MDEHGGSRRYVIRVRGVLSDRLLIAFPGLRSRTEGGDTLLAGTLADQAALYGVLAQIEALRLELLEVHRTTRSTGAPVESVESVGSDEVGSSGRAGRSFRESRNGRDTEGKSEK